MCVWTTCPGLEPQKHQQTFEDPCGPYVEDRVHKLTKTRHVNDSKATTKTCFFPARQNTCLDSLLMVFILSNVMTDYECLVRFHNSFLIQSECSFYSN